MAIGILAQGGDNEAQIERPTRYQDYVRATEAGLVWSLPEVWPLVEEAVDVQLVTPTPTPAPLPPPLAASFPPAEALPVVEPAIPTSIEAIICSFDWPQGCAYWIRLGLCESDLWPSAIGYGGQYVGLFQVWTGHDYGYGWLLNPYNNTLAAWELSSVEIEGVIYGGVNTAPWPVCRWQ